MGTQAPILSLLGSKGLQDSDVLTIINPPLKDRDRSLLGIDSYILYFSDSIYNILAIVIYNILVIVNIIF